jgi:hypothetical protein
MSEKVTSEMGFLNKRGEEIVEAERKDQSVSPYKGCEEKKQEHLYKTDAFILSSDSSVTMEWAKAHVMNAEMGAKEKMMPLNCRQNIGHNVNLDGENPAMLEEGQEVHEGKGKEVKTAEEMRKLHDLLHLWSIFP